MTPFGSPRRHVAECGSSNDLARAWAMDPDDPAPSGALVTAEFQTRGRGRRGRDWQAGPGQSALMSFVYRLGADSEAGQMGLLSALAVTDALASLPGLDPRIKWPNDVLLGGGKVAGILVEAAGQVAILGIGVNVNQERFVGAEGFTYAPTSLRLATGEPQDGERVIALVSEGLTVWADRWQRDGFAPIVDACRERLAVGVSVRRGAETAELAGLTQGGGARVRRADGTFAEWVTVD